MLGFSRWQLIKGLAAIICIASIPFIALAYIFPAPPSKVTIATAFKGSSFEYYGRLYRDVLARSHVTVELRETAGAVENLNLLRDPKSGVDIGFVTGGVSDGSHAPEVLSLGTAYNQPFWIFYSSTETISRLSQLKAKRIAVGPIGSGTRLSAEEILSKGGVNSETATFLPLAGTVAANALNDGLVDAVWYIGAPDSTGAQTMLRSPKIRLVDFPTVEAFTRNYSYLIRLVMPQGVIDFDPPNPPKDVTLLGTTTKVLIRSDLHPEIVNLLLQTMTEVHGGQEIFQRHGEFPNNSDTEYPIAASAMDYYKNGPSFLQRHLPLWLSVHVHRAFALLVTALAIGFPLFNYFPRLYRWFVRERILKLYRRLRIVENELHTEMTVPEITALQHELENIERGTITLRVPTRFSDLFFSLKIHINLIRTRLAARLAEVRSQTAKAA
jgi:TRAP transporter TAXI family solute receptor